MFRIKSKCLKNLRTSLVWLRKFIVPYPPVNFFIGVLQVCCCLCGKCFMVFIKALSIVSACHDNNVSFIQVQFISVSDKLRTHRFSIFRNLEWTTPVLVNYLIEGPAYLCYWTSKKGLNADRYNTAKLSKAAKLTSLPSIMCFSRSGEQFQ